MSLPGSSLVRTMNETGLILTRGTDVRALASGLIGRLSGLTADPFAEPLVLVPGAGMRRWLSQQIARADREGVCAGIRFEPLGRLDQLLGGHDRADDPWAPERLVWRILELVERGEPGLEPLARHLAASEQRYANASRVARLLDRYTRLRPDMLTAWQATDSIDSLGLGFDAWQPALWRALHTEIAAPDPVRARSELIGRVRAGGVSMDAPAVALFCPRALTSADAELLEAWAETRRIDAWLCVAGPRETANPLATRLGQRGAQTADLLGAVASETRDLADESAPATWLGAVQGALWAGRAPEHVELTPGDRTLDVHAGHGPQRQVEVLREVLAGLFADDPTLEPRHVVVACPDPELLAPHLTAAFGGDPLGEQHPGFTFRVQVSERGASEANRLYALVRQVTLLGSTRATAGQLLSIATEPFVARRFGIAGDDADRLADLIAAASVRWGLNDAHRRQFGLERVRQGTWQVGVQRLLMGEALSDDTLASAGVIAPVDDVESSDVVLLGALAELVSRLSRLGRRPDRASASDWIAHMRDIVEQLADPPFEESWQQAQLWAVLDLVARRSADSPALLGASDALALLEAEFATRTARPAFGNGSLVVCSLTALAQVPHRVVCLVGLDERTFPRRRFADGDDLAAADPRPGDPDPGGDDRQSILDAVGAARERLVVIYQGWSSHTREHRPAPPGVVDLIEAAAAVAGVEASGVVVDEPLQPFSPSNFSPLPRSFDLASLRGARALAGPRLLARDRFAVGYLPEAPLDSLDLEQLRAFVMHPAKYFLQQRAGLTLGEDDPLPESLPLELDALQRWKVGDRVLAGLTRGHPLAAVERAEWLRGELPPGVLGQRLLDGVSQTASRVVRDAGPFLELPAVVHTVDLGLDGVRVTGRAATRGDAAVSCEFSKVSPRYLASAWLDSLALSVALERPVPAVLFGGGRRARLTPLDPDAARRALSTLADLALDGRRTVLPLPPRVAHRWAEARAQNADPLADRGLSTLWRWDRDAVWNAVLPVGVRPWDARCEGQPWAQRGEPTQLGSLAALVWGPIVRAEA